MNTPIEKGTTKRMRKLKYRPLYKRADDLKEAIRTFKEEGANDIEDAQRTLEELLFRASRGRKPKR